MKLAANYLMTLDLYDVGVEMRRAQLQDRHPGASEAEINRLLREWLLNRPGDAEGVPVKWPRRQS
jgi:Rv0078B-related antitoxin